MASQAFEALCTKSSADEEDLTPSIINVNPHDLWCAIISRRLGDLRLVIAGEVDCVKGKRIYELRFY